MYYDLPAPIVCGMCGALAGLIGGGFSNCFPVWVGLGTGGSLGCACSIYYCLKPGPPQKPSVLTSREEPIIIQNISHVSGEAKEIPTVECLN